MADTPNFTAVDFLLEHLKQLINSKEIYNQFSMVEKLQIKSLCEDISSLRTFLVDSEMSWHKHEELKDAVIRITDIANEAEDIIDDSIVRNIIKKKDRVAVSFSHVYQSGMLTNVQKEIKSLKKNVSQIYEKKLYDIGETHVGMYSGESSSSSSGSGSGSGSSSSSRAGLPVVEEETVIGFDHDVDTLRERLVGGSKKLDIISIVGMAGSGKTTLATKLYNDGFVFYHFHILGWTYVSQVYSKRDLLLSILSSVAAHRDEFYSMSDENLGEDLYKRLKGNRYLIVMDDMWSTKAWDDMKLYFPNDNIGSRIMITSRLTEVGSHAKSDSPPHLLHFLTKDESWNLLKHKVFGNEICPPNLVEIGEQIAEKCQGLPLSIVVVGGLLAKTYKKKEEWEKLARSLSAHIVSDPKQCMNTLELSYNHLPRHLKLCFLYFGAFPKDYVICVRKLLWLWIAEGFIHQISEKTLEDVAEEYLKDLIDRSLVLVAKKKFGGGIRACRVHDLLRDLCIRKAKEENFMEQFYEHETLSFNLSYPMTYWQRIKFLLFRRSNISIGEKQRRLCIFPVALGHISLKPCAHIRSFMCSGWSPLLPKNFPAVIREPVLNLSITLILRGLQLVQESSLRARNMLGIYQCFKLLKVLDFSTIYLPQFPSQVLQLVLLRYLALRGSDLTLPESISDLLYLETLDVSLSQAINDSVPPNIWKMVSLRHLHISGKYYAYPPDYSPNRGYAGYPSTLPNLQTIFKLYPSQSCQVVLARTPNLRKLGFYGPFVSEEGKFWFPNLHFLKHLEALKLKRTSFGTHLYSKRWNLRAFKFPPNLRRLTLSNTNLDWEEMSTLGMLCNLEVLKLEYSACVGPRWETTSGGFRRLKFLRLKYINIEQWEASNINFPSLQHLLLHECGKLEGIPFEFRNSSTLETIEVDWCSQSTEESARRMQQELKMMGNDWLKILVKPRGCVLGFVELFKPIAVLLDVVKLSLDSMPSTRG